MDVAYGNGKYVAVSGNYIITSTDGVNWTKPQKISSNYWYGIIYSNGKFVITGNGYVTTSVDGENWTTPEQIKDELGKIVIANFYGVCAMP